MPFLFNKKIKNVTALLWIIIISLLFTAFIFQSLYYSSSKLEVVAQETASRPTPAPKYVQNADPASISGGLINIQNPDRRTTIPTIDDLERSILPGFQNRTAPQGLGIVLGVEPERNAPDSVAENGPSSLVYVLAPHNLVSSFGEPDIFFGIFPGSGLLAPKKDKTITETTIEEETRIETTEIPEGLPGGGGGSIIDPSDPFGDPIPMEPPTAPPTKTETIREIRERIETRIIPTPPQNLFTVVVGFIGNSPLLRSFAPDSEKNCGKLKQTPVYPIGRFNPVNVPYFNFDKWQFDTYTAAGYGVGYLGPVFDEKGNTGLDLLVYRVDNEGTLVRGPDQPPTPVQRSSVNQKIGTKVFVSYPVGDGMRGGEFTLEDYITVDGRKYQYITDPTGRLAGATGSMATVTGPQGQPIIVGQFMGSYNDPEVGRVGLIMPVETINNALDNVLKQARERAAAARKKVMRFVISFIVLVSIVAMGFQLYHLYNQKVALQKELEKVNEQIKPLNKENEELVAEINYFKNSDNLEKEFRSQFNYARPGEKLIIVVPKK